MQSNDLTSTPEESVDWPQQPPGILIMGKRQGTKKENKQLRGRAAMAAALWYSAPHPKPYLIFVASDVHGPNRTPDAEMVKYLLTERFGIPDDFLIFRQKTNCTLLEVRAVKAISRVYRLSQIFAVTHLYHAPRTQRYINEVLKEAVVIPVHPAILKEITFPAEAQDLLKELQTLIEASLPNSPDILREHLIEWFLERAHGLDRRGRLERYLARILRPGAYR